MCKVQERASDQDMLTGRKAVCVVQAARGGVGGTKDRRGEAGLRPGWSLTWTSVALTLSAGQPSGTGGSGQPLRGSPRKILQDVHFRTILLLFREWRGKGVREKRAGECGGESREGEGS